MQTNIDPGKEKRRTAVGSAASIFSTIKLRVLPQKGLGFFWIPSVTRAVHDQFGETRLTYGTKIYQSKSLITM